MLFWGKVEAEVKVKVKVEVKVEVKAKVEPGRRFGPVPQEGPRTED